MDRTRTGSLGLPVSLAAALACLMLSPPKVGAALSETGGSGVFEVQSAESKRPGRLEMGFFGSYRALELGDSADTHVNTLLTGVNAAIGFGGGLELSGTLPVYGFYSTAGSTQSPLEESVRLRLGDADARLRWTWPFLIPGMRAGIEGVVRFPTGSNKEVTYPTRSPQRLYTVGENNYFARAMTTWDGLRAGTGVPLRLHANATYQFQRDESRFLLDRGPLALDLPAPVGERDNDVLTLGGAVEVDLSRVTLFGEIVTDQFVNERSLLRGKENRIAVTPGIRLWIPGGLSIAGGYTINLSDDDPSTAFDPERNFPDQEFRVAFSLGTVFRSARAKAEDEAMATPLVIPAVEPQEDVSAAPVDTVQAVKLAKEKEIIERRPIQEAPAPQKPAPPPTETTEPGVTEAAPPSVAATPSPVPAPSAKPAPAPKAPKYVDTDGDGLADDRDHCPLLAEDWDGFQDFDGCPDLDNDQDGIPDLRDQCPNDPETYNGYYDFDGCPDEVGQKWIERPSASAAEGKPGASVEGRVAPRDSVAKSSGRSTAPSTAVPTRPPTALPPAGGRPSATTPTPAPKSAAMTAEPAPESAPAPRVAAAQAPPAVETASRNDQLEARIRQLELELASRGAHQPMSPSAPAPINAPTVIPVPGSGNADLAARITSLEAEVRSLRASGAAPAGAAASGTAPDTGPADTTSRQILDRLGEMQQSIERLEPTSAEAQAPVEAPAAASQEPPEPAAGASLESLDLLLPLGESRVFPEVQFESNQAALTAAGLQAVASLARSLSAVSGSRVSVVGHTDNYGEASYNRALSLERAKTVAEALFAHGVAREQITVEGRGEESPLATNATSAGRRMNRRVEFLRTR